VDVLPKNVSDMLFSCIHMLYFKAEWQFTALEPLG